MVFYQVDLFFFVTAVMIVPFSSKSLGTDGLMHKNK